jgi:hypothetical protein
MTAEAAYLLNGFFEAEHLSSAQAATAQLAPARSFNPPLAQAGVEAVWDPKPQYAERFSRRAASVFETMAPHRVLLSG